MQSGEEGAPFMTKPIAKPYSALTYGDAKQGQTRPGLSNGVSAQAGKAVAMQLILPAQAGRFHIGSESREAARRYAFRVK